MSSQTISQYVKWLREEEKSSATIAKYERQLLAYLRSLPEDGIVTKEHAVAYKEKLAQTRSVSTVNGVVASLNGFFQYMEWEIRLKPLRHQRQIFTEKEKELTRAEYQRLLRTAKAQGQERLWLMMQTICATGIRVSELQYITVRAVYRGRAEVDCKGKRRIILLPETLCCVLKPYICRKNVKSGSVFVTKNGNPIDRSNLWKEMKRLCNGAGVNEGKVYPHSLRHLFARCFYALDRDIAKLADVLGHTNIMTTRIYIMTTTEEHQKQIERLGLLAMGT